MSSRRPQYMFILSGFSLLLKMLWDLFLFLSIFLQISILTCLLPCKKMYSIMKNFPKGKEGIPHIPTYFDINLSLKIEFIIKWTLSLWTQYNSTPHRAGEKGRRVKEGTKEMPQQQNNLKNFLIFPCWPRTHMRRRATSVKETPTEWQSQSVWLTEEQTR